MDHKRDIFSSRRAAIFAMAGSAIGLGNIWRFPYMVGEHGGAAFILVYLFATVFLSLPIFLSESIIGRRTHLGPYGAMAKLAPGTPWKHVGLLTICSAMIIISFYSVVGGWSVDYLFKAIRLEFLPEPHFRNSVAMAEEEIRSGKVYIDVDDPWSNSQNFSLNWQKIEAQVITPKQGQTLSAGTEKPDGNKYMVSTLLGGYSFTDETAANGNKVTKLDTSTVDTEYYGYNYRL